MVIEVEQQSLCTAHTVNDERTERCSKYALRKKIAFYETELQYAHRLPLLKYRSTQKKNQLG